MTVNAFIGMLSQYTVFFAVFFCTVPVAGFCYGLLHGVGKANHAPHKYIYTLLIYLSSVPGIFGAILTAYSLFILRDNLLEVNLVLYFLPVITMILTIVIVKRKANLDMLPGFDRMYGLFILLGVTFIITLVILQTRIWLFFGGSLGALVLIAVFLFGLLKYGSRLLTGKQKGSRPALPKFPNLS